MQVPKVVKQPKPVGGGSGQSQYFKEFKHGYSLVRGTRHGMEDFHVAEFRRIGCHEPGFWEDPVNAVINAYQSTDEMILDEAPRLGSAGSTAVTVIIIDGIRLLVANVGDSRALLCREGAAIQLSVDHDPQQEQAIIEERGGYVSQKRGGVPRVDGRLAMSRAFGDATIKEHLSADPDIVEEWVYEGDEFIILESDGISQVMQNQEAVDLVRNFDDPEAAGKALTQEAVARGSEDDISAIVISL